MGFWRALWGRVWSSSAPFPEETQAALADAYMSMTIAEQIRHRDAIVGLTVSGVAPQLSWMILERAAKHLAKVKLEAAGREVH